ncbi:MAG: PH domain-containing protein [Actinophytocola sp.]|uniref:PH domain-containing protein n=1 Tax=Actinophytocola sp. TaxID=1872138 RepID=UPI001326EAC7|nr:PH domain-containing protein [Actinophytocola sp.]MPZ80975.1 PH domain-containing protein [Actinophytocola sp.]
MDEVLRPPRHRVQRRAIGWWALRVLAGTVVAGGVLGLAYLLVTPWRSGLGIVLVVVVGSGVVLLVVAPAWRYAVHRWEVTEDAVYVRSGWVVREWRIAPISRVQTVDTVRGPLQQALGLATVTVTTASARGPIALVGLDHRTAATVARELAEITQATPGDAT